MSVVSFVLSGKSLGTAAGAVGGAIGLISLSLFAAALITFPAWPTTAGLKGAGFSATPAFSVDRALKGDRLPVSVHPTAAPLSDESQPVPAHPRTRAQIPLGCDAAFSPISAPRLAHVFRRCAV